MSSPKVNKLLYGPDDAAFPHLPSMKREVHSVKDQAQRETPLPKNYPPEIVLNQKNFSPILTPYRPRNNKITGESALRTPNSKLFASGEKRSPGINTPDYRFGKQQHGQARANHHKHLQLLH